VTILLTGGTGALGRLVLPLLRAYDRVRILSRTPHDDPDFVVGDLATGAGLDAAVAGADTILHCAGSAKGDEDKARQLVRAAARAGRPHIVNISVVGADRVPVVSRADRAMFGYFAAQHAAEQVIATSGLPWTNLRATQFHSLTLTVAAQLAKLPVIPVPAGVRFQPIDGAEVAARLVELAGGEPAGQVPELAGPQVLGMAEIVRAYLRATGRRRPIVALPLGGGAYRAVRAGANLAPERAAGGRTWAAFLACGVG
jgi:uncharacterized protein YbjT (DUF2867 family)